jgi:hypothetical protein
MIPDAQVQVRRHFRKAVAELPMRTPLVAESRQPEDGHDLINVDTFRRRGPVRAQDRRFDPDRKI